MTPTECARRHTRRQLRAWLAWVDMGLNRPGRTDAYLMQIAAEIVKTPARVWGKEPKGPNVNDMKLTFRAGDEPPKPKAEPASVEAATAMSKAIWMARVGMAPRVTSNGS